MIRQPICFTEYGSFASPNMPPPTPAPETKRTKRHLKAAPTTVTVTVDAGPISFSLLPISIRSMIGTNKVPSEAEAGVIRLFLQHRKAYFEALPTTDTETSAVRALLSPARRLAPETVAHIFELCLPEDRLGVYRITEAPLLVSQLCSGWRHVALSTPKLWTHLSVVPRLPHEVHLAHVLWASQIIIKATLSSLLWLSRARTLPLYVSVACVSVLPADSRYSKAWATWLGLTTKLVADLLTQHGQQIKHLSLKLPVSCTLPLLNVDCLSLKRLVIVDKGAGHPPPSRNEESSAMQLGAGRARKLHDVVLTVPHLRIQKTRLPWAQLTHLTVTDPMSLVDCCIIFGTCQRLHTLRFHVGLNLEFPYAVNLPIVNKSIKELGVYGQPSESGATILDAIAAPNLRKLIIGDGYDQVSLVQFIANLHSPLLSLSFKNIPHLLEEDLIEILERVPSLRELFAVGTFHDNLLEALTPDGLAEDWGLMCPQLESVELRLQLATEQLIDFLERRWGPSFRNQGVAQLKRAHIIFMSPHQRDESWDWDEVAWRQQLEKWRREGMDLVISYHRDQQTLPFDASNPDGPES